MPATPRTYDELMGFPDGSEAKRATLWGEAESVVGRDTRLLSTAEMALIEPPIWYMERIVQEDGLSMLYGEPKMGKTFLAMEWAWHLALGKDWYSYHVDAPVRVIYAAAEGLLGLGMRQETLKEVRGWQDTDNLKWMTGSRALIGDVMTIPIAELIEAVHDYRPQVVFLDTLLRHTPGSDVGSNPDMAEFIYWLDQIREAYGCSFVVIHHSRKGDDFFLGAQVLHASVDVFLQLRSDPDLGMGRDGPAALFMEAKEWDDSRLSFNLEVKAQSNPPQPGRATIEPAMRGLSSDQERLLKYLRAFPDATTAQVQEEIWKKKGDNARQLLVKLEKKGWVVSHGDPTLWRAKETE